MWSLPREAYSSQRSFMQTEFNISYGAHGDDPRTKLPHDATKQTHAPHELTMGTTQVTTHLPGYSGFIPKSDFNQRAVEQSKLEGRNRTTIVKENIVENFAVRISGYGGHQPLSSANDRGVIRPHCLSTEGETFK